MKPMTTLIIAAFLAACNHTPKAPYSATQYDSLFYEVSEHKKVFLEKEAPKADPDYWATKNAVLTEHDSMMFSTVKKINDPLQRIIIERAKYYPETPIQYPQTKQ
jgi:hypothetical protein